MKRVLTSNDHNKIFGADGDILYHDFGGHLMSKYMSKLTKSHTLNSGILLHINYFHGVDFKFNCRKTKFDYKKISKVILKF